MRGHLGAFRGAVELIWRALELILKASGNFMGVCVVIGVAAPVYMLAAWRWSVEWPSGELSI